MTVGIDIGLHGAIAVVHGTKLMYYCEMPIYKNQGKPDIDVKELSKTLSHVKRIYNTNMFAWEYINNIYGVSKNTMRSLGIQIGYLRMFCAKENQLYKEIAPKIWQKQMFIPVNKSIEKDNDKKTKIYALEAAKLLLHEEIESFKKRTKYHDGLIDAFLIAQYIENNLNN